MKRSIWIAATFLMFLHSGNAYGREDAERAGDVLRILIPAIGFAATLFGEHGYAGSIQFAKSLAVSQLTTEGLKLATHKKRPNGGDYKSFPSGHTTSAFMGAAFIHKRYGWKYSIPAYMGATYVGYSRVNAEKHFYVDVIGGATIGILSAYFFTTPYRGFTVTPIADEDGSIGIGIRKTW